MFRYISLVIITIMIFIGPTFFVYATLQDDNSIVQYYVKKIIAFLDKLEDPDVSHIRYNLGNYLNMTDDPVTREILVEINYILPSIYGTYDLYTMFGDPIGGSMCTSMEKKLEDGDKQIQICKGNNDNRYYRTNIYEEKHREIDGVSGPGFYRLKGNVQIPPCLLSTYGPQKAYELNPEGCALKFLECTLVDEKYLSCIQESVNTQ